MSDSTVPQTVLFPDLVEKPVVATFDQPHASSDGGALLLKAVDRRLGVIDAVAAAISDRRDPVKVTHSIRDLVAQRIFGIACGHPDGNDGDALADDPCTSCCSIAIRWMAAAWPRNRRSREADSSS